MFDILQEWLTSKLGINNCWNLNYDNVGERFKDGVLFARLLQKYQVIPDCYVQNLKKTNYHIACLKNMKNINLWLKFVDIFIEDGVLHEIANGQSHAVTKLLYELYLKLETLKQRHACDYIDIKKIETIDNNAAIFCKKNDLSIKSNQDRKKHKKKLSNIIDKEVEKEVFNGLSLFCCLEGNKYTAVDVLKSKKNINSSKNSVLNFIQNNMNYFYDLLMKNLNSELFINDIDEKYNEICRSSIFYILDMIEDTTQNINFLPDHLSYISQEEIKNENSTLNSSDMESLTTQSLDKYSYKHFVKQNIFDDYIQHTGLWSSEHLKVDQYECKQGILSMIVGDILNFEHDISVVQFLEIKKANVTGVIDVIQNTKVMQSIKKNLDSNEILSFTADDALTACLEAYKEEMKISTNKEELYRVFEDYEHKITPKQYSYNKKQEKQDVNTETTHVATEEKIYINKLTQTPEQIPEPDYNNPLLNSMAALGKLIDEKQTKNLGLQIGDVINCIGEYIKKNQGKNGWLLFDFPVQPLQMTLLEYKLTGKIPTFGKDICKNIKKKSKIITEYEDSENAFASKNTYLSHCIKIIRHQDEMKNEKWNEFLQFYKQDCIRAIFDHFNNIIKQPKKAANALIGLILNNKNQFETKYVFKSIKLFENDGDEQGDDDSIESENNPQISELSTTNYEEMNSINSKQITNQFLLLSAESNLNNYTALRLCNTWKTMEYSYIHQITESLNLKDDLFEQIKINMDSITNTVNHMLFFHKPSTTHLIDKYENESLQVKDNTTNIMHTIFELQTNLWDEVDSEFDQITQYINKIIDNQHVVAKNNTLISIHKQLIEIELKRTTTTLNVLNGYYNDRNEYEINELDCVDGINESENDIDAFQLLCTDIIFKIEKYTVQIYEIIELIDDKTWAQSIETEKNRFVSQVNRIKASMLQDKKYLEDLTKIDHHLEKIHNVYQFKINDINKLCEILKCAAGIGKSLKGHIEQISGQFFVNKTSIFEIIYNQIFDSRNTFNMNQLKTIVNKLLDDAPTFKMPISDLIDTLNKLDEEQRIYPTNWPTYVQFNNNFVKEILGNNVIAIDWRDFVVQCMELPFPNIDQLLMYRKLFQTYDIGDETIAVENFITTKLWFENESCQYDEAKWLLCDMYQVKNRLNYSTMLLAFCRDEQTWMGLGKSFCLIFGWNPFGVKMQQVNQSDSRYDYEGSEIKAEDMNSNINLSEFPDEKFNFDKNTMTWFLTTILKLYMDDEKQLGIIDISQMVKSVFTQIKTKGIEPTIINLFQNNVMDELYNTVYKFQIKELSEVGKKIVMRMTNKIF